MSSFDEKATPSPNLAEADSTHGSDDQHDRSSPTGWMYQEHRLGFLKIPYYASPKAQLLLVAFVCFLCPGMFNAVNGLGGGGQLDAKASSASNTALYSTFAAVGFFAGTITNTIGIRWSLAFGGIGYSVYIAAYLCYNFTQNLGFITFAGALLGVCAGILWTAQGAIMMSYPLEAEKGRFISWFWMIFNMGGVIGSLVPLGQNIHNDHNGTVSNGTYIGFLILTFIGGMLAWVLVDAKKVVRSDGSKVILMKHPTWKSELLGLWETLTRDPWVLCLFPMFFASNWFYTYQFNGVNLARFTVRTRALNNVLYWFMQIVGAYIVGNLLDLERFSRTMRAKGCWIVLFVLTMAIWGGGYAFQVNYTRESVAAVGSDQIMDWSEGRYIGPMFLYMFYGFYDAAWQTSVYWLMGALSNNSRTLANYAGFYKGIQSAGAAIMWRMDGLKISYMSELGSCWGLLAGSLVIALPMMIVKIRDTTPVEDDLQFTDETMDDIKVGKPVGNTTATDLEEKA